MSDEALEGLDAAWAAPAGGSVPLGVRRRAWWPPVPTTCDPDLAASISPPQLTRPALARPDRAPLGSAPAGATGRPSRYQRPRPVGGTTDLNTGSPRSAPPGYKPIA
jgi:hypothetical protein